MSTKRMTANPIKAPRYRPGKGVAEEGSSSEDESADEKDVQDQEASIAPPPKVTSAGGITSNLKKVDLSERRRKAAADETARLEAEKALRAKEEEGFVTEESEDKEDSEDGSDGGSGSEEDSSEEEAPRKVMLRPTFIKKGKRNAELATKGDVRSEAEILKEEEDRRKEAADAIVEEQIQKDLAAKVAGKKNWDDEDEDVDDVDDTDGLDPESEYAAWKLRELKRIKRDREVIEAREAELAELERRRNLTEEERKEEDEEYLAKQKEEKDSKGKMNYMQKYYHKGAFFQDDLKAEGLDRRDLMGSKSADDVQHRELLPQALQLRDMTKLGKKSASKYRDLKTEDTGKWGQFEDKRPGKGFGGGYGADERFAPDRERGGPGASGANSMPVSKRKERSEGVIGAPEGPRAMRGGDGMRRDSKSDDYYRPAEKRSRSTSRSRSPRRRYDERNRSRSRSRSRSPGRRRGGRYRSISRSRSPRRRYDDDRNWRKRSSSRNGRHYEDKRRRIDSR